MAEEQDSKLIEQSLFKLAECEKDMDKAERDAEIYRIKRTQSIFQRRREILSSIPKFWYIILAENDDFSDYISVEDLKYLECITDIYVHYKITDSDPKNPKDFTITVEFGDDGLVPAQTITKEFEVEIEEGEEKITSKAVEVVWPAELLSINPHAIKAAKGKDLSKEDKKNYRLGMKSFFAWFSWTGLKPGKEFRSGEDLTRLITDDLFPYAVKYYTEALPGADEGDEDSSDPEELDVDSESDDDRKRKAEDDDGPRKR